jgi:hypothetical protein
MQMRPSADEVPTAPDVSGREVLRSSGRAALRWSVDDTVPASGMARDDASGADNGTTMAWVPVGPWRLWAMFGFAGDPARTAGRPTRLLDRADRLSALIGIGPALRDARCSMITKLRAGVARDSRIPPTGYGLRLRRKPPSRAYDSVIIFSSLTLPLNRLLFLAVCGCATLRAHRLRRSIDRMSRRRYEGLCRSFVQGLKYIVRHLEREYVMTV